MKLTEDRMTSFTDDYDEEGVVRFQFGVTKECNLACPWCINSVLETSKMRRPHYPRRMDLVNKWMGSPNHKMYLQFSGGEPMLEPQIMLDILDELTPENLSKLYRIGILTNGTIYDEKLFNAIIDRNPNLVVHLSHKKLGFNVRSKDTLAAKLTVEHLGNAATWFPVITMENYHQYVDLMWKAYAMGYRRWNVKLELNTNYRVPLIQALEDWMKVCPDDFVLIQAHNNCRNNFHLDWIKQYGIFEPERISVAPKSELNYSVAPAEKYIHDIRTMNSRNASRLPYPGPQPIIVYLAMLHEVPMVSNQHSNEWCKN